MKRRNFLTILGGGVVLAASAGYITTRTPTKALAPWTRAGTSYQEPRMRALSYAILAPNPHNRQPWLVDLSQADKILLMVDTERMLPHTDPLNRQITIGLGCFLEQLRIAAAQDGYSAIIDPFPEGADANNLDTRPVASIRFVNDNPAKDPLFQHILARRSDKTPFDLSRNVPDTALQSLLNIANTDVDVGATNNSAKIAALRGLTRRALEIEIATPRTYKESVDLFRIGKSEVNANPDGIDFTGPMFESLGMLGMFSREKALDTGSSVYQQGIAAVMENVDTAMGYVWLTTKTNARIDQLNAGRDWLRVNLMTTALGLSLHPLSQALQEFPEVSAQYAMAHEMLDGQNQTVQMLGRIGYGAKVPPSPRWQLEDKIIEA